MEPDELRIPLSGGGAARIVITALPRGRALVARSGRLALRESATYRYRVDGVPGDVRLEPGELVEPDDGSGRTGRIRPGQSVGRLRFALRAGATTLHGDVHVVPATFAQPEQYRQMLDDIAEHAAEAVLQGFAPTTQDFSSGDASAELLYQRFAVLQSRLASDDFAAASGRVVHQPHHGWEVEVEHRPAGSGFPRGSAAGRAITAPGARRSWPAGQRAGIPSIPSRMPVQRHESTVDTLPNRFVKYALEHWRGIADQLLDVLGVATDLDPGPVRRGRDAARDVIEQLDELLSNPVFREVGPLAALPTSNQVLLRRYGYRDIFRTFALVETGVALSFEDAGLDDLFSASQRNIATLYEFWCFLALADAVGRVCGASKTAHAFTAVGDGLALTLRSGQASAISWTLDRGGRRLAVELYFNRHFSVVHGSHSADGSWTRAMRPDCSLRVRPLTAVPGDAELDVWVHFDAKYRVDRLVEQLSVAEETVEAQAAAEEERAETVARSKREDLLKMHAYRDAIHRTAGAYVLYPGDVPVQVSRYWELLPGLGAFPLRPGPLGAFGAQELEQFVDSVIEHVSDQASDDERDRFWTASVRQRNHAAPRGLAPASFLERPPADTGVLLGYVRGDAHRGWIEDTGLYNVRAGDRAGAVTLGSRELSASLVLLYGNGDAGLRCVRLARVGTWRAADQADLLRWGYPDPRGSLYFVTDLTPVPDVPNWLDSLDIRWLLPKAHRPGAPIAVTWWDVLRSGSSSAGR